jgi:MFS family permease
MLCTVLIHCKGLGGAGQFTTEAAAGSNTATYATVSVVGFFAGTITNKLGIKITLACGGFGYCLYIASYLCYNHTANYGFIIFAGVFLGICAGGVWSAQGAIMMAYPPEGSKGRYIAWFWVIFNFGGVIGSLVPLGQNIGTTSNAAVSDGTYIGFIVLSALGAILAVTLCDAKHVIRSDGSKVIVMQHPSWKSEFLGIWQTLFSDTYVLLLFPMFFASNWFYTYHFNDVNLAQFNTRTRSLNNVLYWFSQMIGATIAGCLLDVTRIRRSLRARLAWLALFALTCGIWGGGYVFQKGYTRAEVNAGLDTPDDPSDDYVKMDWSDSNYIGAMFLYIFYGVYDAIWQTIVYW